MQLLFSNSTPVYRSSIRAHFLQKEVPEEDTLGKNNTNVDL